MIRKIIKTYRSKKILRLVKTLILDFDGVLTDNKVFTTNDGEEFVVCSKTDSAGLHLIRGTINIMVLTGEKSPCVKKRCDKLNISCYQSNNKYNFIMTNNLPLDEILYVGNDLNDLECINFLPMTACPNDAVPEIIRAAKFVTKKNGGNGAVREICEWIKHEKGI